MSNGRCSFNLQSDEQMNELRKLLGGKYERRVKRNGQGVEADEEPVASVRHRRPTMGDNQ